MTDDRCQTTEKLPAIQPPPAAFRDATMLSREDTHSEEARSQKPEARKPPVSSHPNSLGIHRSIRLALSTTLTAQRRLGSLPLHLSKIKHPRARTHGANLLFPIDHSSFACRGRCPRALAAQGRRCRTSRQTMLRIVCAVVEVIGIEPTTSCLQSRRSPN